MGSEADQPLLQPHEQEKQQEPKVQEESHEMGFDLKTRVGQVILKLKQLKSLEILRSAVTTFAGDFRFMFLMILSIVPLCAFMIFYEIKLQKMIETLPNFLDNSPRVIVISVAYHSRNLESYRQHDDGDDFRRKFFPTLLQLSLFYLVLYPALEIFSVVTTIKFAAKTRSGETQVPLKQILKQNNLEGTFITYLCVHLLSTVALLGLFWAVVNHHLFSYRFFSYGFSYPYDFLPIEFYLYLLSIGLHSAIFMALLYKYLGWSAFWNMAMVISVLEEETGIDAFGLSDYYGKHCKQTGFQLMLVFFAFCNFLRLPALFFGLCNPSCAGVCVTAIVIGLFCLGNLVKWVAMVLYFYDCKQQVMEKKGDEEVGKSVKKAVDVC